MAKITFNGASYVVDHAAKGTDYVHGYDADGNLVFSLEGIKDFSVITYDGMYMNPTECLTESCNNVKYCGGRAKTLDDRELPASAVGARPDTWTPTASDVGARPDNWTPTASDVGALPDTGGTMKGTLNMNGKKITGLKAPTADDEPATKGYAIAKESVVNNFATTEEGFVADARALKVVNDKIENFSHIRELSPGNTIDITFATYRTSALVFTVGSNSNAICYLYSNGYLSPLKSFDKIPVSLSDDYKTITVTNNASGIYSILGVLHLGTTSMTVNKRS